MIILESAGITDVGMKRKGNEDSLLLDDTQKLYVVADGMGGHQAGEVASAMVVDTIKDYMQRFQKDQAVEELDDADESLSKAANRLMASINLANNAVHMAAAGNAAYRSMGSTVSAVYFTDATLIAGNVGDSPIYLIREEQIDLISVMHTLMAEQAALDPENAGRLSEKYRHVITRAMGIKATVEADICEIQCFAGDTLVICSDGLSDKLTPEGIKAVVSRQRPQKACRELVDTANERGGDDNITVIVLNIKKIGTPRSRLLDFAWWWQVVKSKFFE